MTILYHNFLGVSQSLDMFTIPAILKSRIYCRYHNWISAIEVHRWLVRDVTACSEDLCQKSSISLDCKKAHILWSVLYAVISRTQLHIRLAQFLYWVMKFSRAQNIYVNIFISLKFLNERKLNRSYVLKTMLPGSYKTLSIFLMIEPFQIQFWCLWMAWLYRE